MSLEKNLWQLQSDTADTACISYTHRFRYIFIWEAINIAIHKSFV